MAELRRFSPGAWTLLTSERASKVGFKASSAAKGAPKTLTADVAHLSSKDVAKLTSSSSTAEQ
eukprot:CAMPEP_0183431942 /NCGR_PEP_ID=MMETSP0370-20130417/55149_1 /TAXON_ID=268820 /ORGANISM="Peridinium aciculiferum, Strain PAER-2" /LENGTH=62 /DNA_ID=CAMNT_0025617767 /DNA_START=496 /DNA_END=684 /DNA_ORIENTATION=+